MSDLQPFLTIEETAELLRLNPGSIYKMAQRGEVPGAAKIGRAWRIHRDTLLRSLMSETRGPRSSRR
ncbi:MAG: helix-turn-helix domain-containing protein [Myxococcota bacterium]